jgi:FkbM family methyltransferase
VTPAPFESYSQNGEDVVLWRALHRVENGRYIDVGANHPRIDSVSLAFYEHGWQGITIEPDPAFANMQVAERPRDLMIEAAITVKDRDAITLHVVNGTGLSTLDGALAQGHARSGYDTHDVEVVTRTMDSVLEEAGWHDMDIHFMSIDTEGSERDVLESIDLHLWRPWVLVVEATAPTSTESTRHRWEDIVLDAGYRFCLFDGLSCFYVSAQKADELGDRLSYPACVFDDYTTPATREADHEYVKLADRVHQLDELATKTVPDLIEQVTRWRAQAVNRWATAIANEAELEAALTACTDLQDTIEEMHRAIHLERIESRSVIAGLQAQLDDLLKSSSWRITKPLRLLGNQAAKKDRR